MAEAPSPAPAASPARLRLAGVVAGEPGEAVLADVTMRADGNDTPSGPWTRPFELVLGNGDRVRIEVAPDARLMMPEGSARGAWRDVEGHALARPFREKAP